MEYVVFTSLIEQSQMLQKVIQNVYDHVEQPIAQADTCYTRLTRTYRHYIRLLSINLYISFFYRDRTNIYTGWPRKNATTFFVNFEDIVNLFLIFQQNDTW